MIKQAIQILDRVNDPAYVSYLEYLDQVNEKTIIKDRYMYFPYSNTKVYFPKYKWVDDELIRAKVSGDHDQMLLLEFMKSMDASRYTTSMNDNINELNAKIIKCRKKKNGKGIMDSMADKSKIGMPRPQMRYITEMPRIVTGQRNSPSPKTVGIKASKTTRACSRKVFLTF